jgi:hypothetical protein
MKKKYFFPGLLSVVFYFSSIAQPAFDNIKIDKGMANPLHPMNANLGFEAGLNTWTATGNAFANQPVQGNITSDRVLQQMQYSNGGIGGDYWKGMVYETGAKGSWIGTYEKNNGDGPTGTLTSKPFIALQRYLTFLLGGGNDVVKLFVELQIKTSDFEAAWGAQRRPGYGYTEDGYARVSRINSALNSEEMYRYYFDLDEILNHQFTNKSMRIHIVDNSSTGWGHINVDDFTFAPDLNNYLRINRGFPLLVDKNKPVWGFADTHGHPMSQLAFGGKLMAGSVTGPMHEALRWCNDPHGNGGSLNNPETFHLNGGYPEFDGWPRFTSLVHQQMYIDWIKRAYQGGQRLMCALTITNMYVASRIIIPNEGLPIDDYTVAKRQIALMKNIASQNSDWMKIAYTPDEARAIIHENKLAIILGMETDIFADLVDNSITNNNENFVRLPNDPSQAATIIRSKVQEIYDLGIRQVTPLHYVSGTFGGTAIFSRYHSIVNENFTGSSYRAIEGFDKGIRYTTRNECSNVAVNLFSGGTLNPNTGETVYSGTPPKGDMNAMGLTDNGKILFTELMNKGIIIDLDHASFKSTDDIIQLALQHNNYPVVSTHSDFFDLGLTGIGESNRNTAFRMECGVTATAVQVAGALVGTSTNSANLEAFGTTVLGNLRHEGMILPSKVQAIKKSGGFVAPLMIAYRRTAFPGSNVPNDCEGSSKTFAQEYLYALDKMNGKGIALSTDRGFVPFIGPRFGVNAAFTLSNEEVDELKKVKRREQTLKQENGVRYDVGISDWRAYRFQESGGGGAFDFDGKGGSYEDAWKAVAAYKANRNPWTMSNHEIPPSGEADHHGKIENYVRGMFGTYQQASEFIANGGRSTTERLAGFFITHPYNNPNDLPADYRTGQFHTEFLEHHNFLKSVWDRWQKMEGNNEPLRRHTAGRRDFDINLDGVAHYGMLPDFIQDLKNVGLTPKQLTPLFNSSEDFIQTWEKCIKRR